MILFRQVKVIHEVCALMRLAREESKVELFETIKS